MELADLFIRDYLDKKAPGLRPPDGPATAPASEVKQTRALLLHAAHHPRIPEETLALVRGRQGDTHATLLAEGEQGLRERPAVRQELNAAPGALEYLARQLNTIGAVVRAWERLYDGADTGLLLTAEEVEAAMDEIDDALRRALRALPPAAGSALSRLFAEAIRLRARIEADRARAAAAGAGLRDPAGRAALIDRFLLAIERGEVDR